MPHTSARALAAALLLGLLAACGEPSAAPGKTQPPAPTGPPEQYESTRGGFLLTLPAAFRGNYRVKESVDSVLGAKFAAEIVFPADAAGKVPPRTLLVIRVFTKAAWEKLSAQKGFSGAVKRAERGGDVFTLSMISSNPYNLATEASRTVERMMLAATAGGLHVDITPR